MNKTIYSEYPSDHWGDVSDLTNKIVLDLGCGWQHIPTTIEYFIGKRASKIIGVDINCNEIEEYKKRYPDHIFICSKIDSGEDIIKLLVEYQPQMVKIDIEGFEVNLKDVPIEYFSCVEEFAIEYHTAECKEIVTKFISESLLTIFAMNKFGYYCTDSDIMGVIHAKRIIN